MTVEITLPPALPCAACSGHGEIACPTCDGSGLSGPLKVGHRPSRVELERDGWREIANALMGLAFGHDVHAPGARPTVPPREIIESVMGQPDQVEAIRAAMIGRAWRVGGKRGAGTCDYPLCPNRAAWLERKAAERSAEPYDGTLPTLSLVSVSLVPVSQYDFSTHGRATLHVCRSPRDLADECHAWATWVQRRVSAGRISLDS